VKLQDEVDSFNNNMEWVLAESDAITTILV